MPKLVRSLPTHRHRHHHPAAAGASAAAPRAILADLTNGSDGGNGSPFLPPTGKAESVKDRRCSDATASTTSSSCSAASPLHDEGGAAEETRRGGGTGVRGRQSKRWEERFDELVRFKVLYGSCRVPHRYADNPGLSRWVVYMRSSRQSGTLRPDREARLTALGFAWGDRGHTTWDQRYDQLVEYVREHGTTRVTCDTPENQQLWRWCSVQRANRRLGKLLPHRIQALDELGFVWDVDQHEWDTKCDELAEFCGQHGHCRIPNREPFKKLFLWARVQRSKYDSGSLSQDRVERLQKLGFGWEKNAMYTSATGHNSTNEREMAADAAEAHEDVQGEDDEFEDENGAAAKECHHRTAACQGPPQYYHTCGQPQYYSHGATAPTPVAQQHHHHLPHPASSYSTSSSFSYSTTYSAERCGPPPRPRPAEVSTAKKPLPSTLSMPPPAAASTVRSPMANRVVPPAADGFDRLFRLAELARQVSPVRIRL